MTWYQIVALLTVCPFGLMMFLHALKAGIGKGSFSYFQAFLLCICIIIIAVVFNIGSANG